MKSRFPSRRLCGFHLVHPAVVILATLVTIEGSARAEAAERVASSSTPNFVYIMLDEWAYFELSSMGHKLIQTPVIDRMAAEGVRFTQCLAGGNVCASTRSSLMTGQHTGHCSRRYNSHTGPVMMKSTWDT